MIGRGAGRGRRPWSLLCVRASNCSSAPRPTAAGEAGEAFAGRSLSHTAPVCCPDARAGVCGGRGGEVGARPTRQKRDGGRAPSCARPAWPASPTLPGTSLTHTHYACPPLTEEQHDARRPCDPAEPCDTVWQPQHARADDCGDEVAGRRQPARCIGDVCGALVGRGRGSKGWHRRGGCQGSGSRDPLIAGRHHAARGTPPKRPAQNG